MLPRTVCKISKMDDKLPKSHSSVSIALIPRRRSHQMVSSRQGRKELNRYTLLDDVQLSEALLQLPSFFPSRHLTELELLSLDGKTMHFSASPPALSSDESVSSHVPLKPK